MSIPGYLFCHRPLQASCALRNYFTLTILCSHSELYCVHICTIIIRLALWFPPLVPPSSPVSPTGFSLAYSPNVHSCSSLTRLCWKENPSVCNDVSRSFVCPASRFPIFLLSWYHSLVCCICVFYPPCRIYLRHLLIAVTHSRRTPRLELCSGANYLGTQHE